MNQMLQRKTSNKDNMAKLRQRTVTVKSAILVFEHEIKLGPDFVCTCCHRTMYKKSVVPCNRGKYTKASSDVLEKVFSFELRYISPDDKEWVCKTCDRTLVRGSMPVQAKANGLKLCEIPSELSRLNVLELRLICLRVPFMKMVALPAGKQKSIHGPAVNVPSKVDTICNVLSRLPSQTELVPLKLKRKLAYRGHYMYDYVIPQVVLDALGFLKSSNPLYALVEVNEQWLDQAVANDEELCKSLVEHEDMDTESEHDLPQGEPMEHSNCSDDDTTLSVAIQKLETVAHQSGFI